MSSLADAVRHLEDGDWQAAHRIVQDDTAPEACWAHGIVHLMEGDLGNAAYWYRRAGRSLPETGRENAAARHESIRAEIAELRNRV